MNTNNLSVFDPNPAEYAGLKMFRELILGVEHEGKKYVKLYYRDEKNLCCVYGADIDECRLKREVFFAFRRPDEDGERETIYREDRSWSNCLQYTEWWALSQIQYIGIHCGLGIPTAHEVSQAKKIHAAIVAEAIQRGLPVPQEVMI